jgi:hypothetical protein
MVVGDDSLVGTVSGGIDILVIGTSCFGYPMLEKVKRFVCFYHPNREAFVDVGLCNKKFYVCLECYLQEDRDQWRKDQFTT